MVSEEHASRQQVQKVGQALTSRISSGTLLTDLGTDRLKTGNDSNSAFASEPSWMLVTGGTESVSMQQSSLHAESVKTHASMIARVYLSGHRLPVPNLPPV